MDFLINQSNTDYARQTFQNSNGKSFTLAAVNGGAIADVLNIYSEKLSQNLISISSDSKQNITLNGSTVLGSILFHPSVNPVPISLFIPNVTTEGISVLRYEVNGYDLSIGGFTGGVEGRILIVEMTGTGTLTFKDYNSSSSPENQLYLPKNGILSRDITIDDQHIVQFIYLGGHWKVMAKS